MQEPPEIILDLNNKSTEEDVIAALHNMRATHSGLKFSIQLAAESHSTTTPFQGLRTQIESKFFQGRGIAAFEKLPPGKRPDTLRFKGIPKKWLSDAADEADSSSPSHLLGLKSILTKFGKVVHIEEAWDASSNTKGEVTILFQAFVGIHYPIPTLILSCYAV